MTHHALPSNTRCRYAVMLAPFHLEGVTIESGVTVGYVLAADMGFALEVRAIAFQLLYATYGQVLWSKVGAACPCVHTPVACCNATSMVKDELGPAAA